MNLSKGYTRTRAQLFKISCTLNLDVLHVEVDAVAHGPLNHHNARHAVQVSFCRIYSLVVPSPSTKLQLDNFLDSLRCMELFPFVLLELLDTSYAQFCPFALWNLRYLYNIFYLIQGIDSIGAIFRSSKNTIIKISSIYPVLSCAGWGSLRSSSRGLSDCQLHICGAISLAIHHRNYMLLLWRGHCHYGLSSCHLRRHNRGHEEGRQKKIIRYSSFLAHSYLPRFVDSLSTTDSDSDSSIERLTNRGNKLRKRARYVHQGQLAPPTGPQVYREVRDESRSCVCTG